MVKKIDIVDPSAFGTPPEWPCRAGVRTGNDFVGLAPLVKKGRTCNTAYFQRFENFVPCISYLVLRF